MGSCAILIRSCLTWADQISKKLIGVTFFHISSVHIKTTRTVLAFHRRAKPLECLTRLTMKALSPGFIVLCLAADICNAAIIRTDEDFPVHKRSLPHRMLLESNGKVNMYNVAT